MREGGRTALVAPPSLRRGAALEAAEVLLRSLATAFAPMAGARGDWGHIERATADYVGMVSCSPRVELARWKTPATSSEDTRGLR